MHLHHIHELPELRLAAICDLSRELLDAVGGKYGVDRARRFRDYHDLLGTDVEAVVVLNTLHAQPVLDALAAGKHVFVEKPLCWTVAEADAIVDQASSVGTTVMVGYMRRYDPGVRIAAYEVAKRDGAFLARLHNFAGGRQRRDFAHPVVKPRDVDRAGLNAALRATIQASIDSDDPRRIALFRLLMELCTHDLNLQRRLFTDPPELESATFEAGEVPTFVASIRFGSGIRAVWDVAPLFDGALEWDHDLRVYAPQWSLEIRFRNPFLRVSPTDVLIRESHEDSVAETLLRGSAVSPFAEELRHFARCVRGTATLETSATDARTDVAFFTQVAREAEIAGAHE
jgi:predicted dehydrogenase